MTNALVPLAEGAEEIEAVTIIDVLRRAEWTVVSAGLAGREITASRGVRIVADKLWSQLDPSSFDAIILPGGAQGASNLRSDERLLDVLRHFDFEKKTIAAICAAPLVLQSAGILNGRKVTCHPAVLNELEGQPVKNADVVVDGHIITSKGPGTAIRFALEVVKAHNGAATARNLAEALVCEMK